MKNKEVKARVISTGNLRECHFFFSYLSNKGVDLPVFTRGNIDPATYCNVMNEALSKFEIEKRNRLIYEMEQACKHGIFPKANLDWIKDNERACHWVWCYLRNVTDDELMPQKKEEYKLASYISPAINNYQSPYRPPLYVQMKLALVPVGHRERFSTILYFFDAWAVHLDDKNKLVNSLKERWSKVFKESKPFSWFNSDDKAQCLWLWEYMKKTLPPYTITVNVTGEDDLASAIQVTFDYWMGSEMERKYIISSANKAWAQKKYRDGLVKKKPLNTYVTNEAKDKLNLLAEVHGKKINEVIEMLIIQEYKRLNT